MLLHEADAVEFIYQIMVAKDHKHTLISYLPGRKCHGMSLPRLLPQEWRMRSVS